MIRDRSITGVAIYRRGAALVVRVEADDGEHGWAESVDGADLLDAVVAIGTVSIGGSPWDGGARWSGRPRVGGAAWAAFSALDSACFDLVARSAGLSLRHWLGGSARDAAARFDGRIPTIDAGDRCFDDVVAELGVGGAAAVLVDPRRSGTGALTRLDSVCRVLQVEIALDVGGGGPLARALATELAVTLPMATLGVRGDGPDPDPAPIDGRPPVAVIGSIR